MKNLRFSTVILSLVLAVLTVVSVILIEVVYSGAEKAIQYDIQQTYERDQRNLNRLMAAQFNNIHQISQELSKSKGVRLGLIANDTSHYAHIIDDFLADISGQYIDAIAIEEKSGSSIIFSNISLLGIQLPLEQIIQHHSPLLTWTSVMTEVEGKHFSLLHLSLPVIDEQFGEVIGKLHTFVLLNDNFWISNQLQELFGSQAISLSSGNTILDGLENQPGQLQILSSAANNTGNGIISTENSTLRTHYLRIGNSDNYMVRSLLSNSAQQLLHDTYTTNLYYATALVIMLGGAVMLVIRYLIISALHQITLYAEQVPQNGSPSPFRGGRFHEFIRVGKAVEQMLLRIRERDKHLSSIIDNSPDLIFIRDLQHNFQLINQRFVEVMNTQPEQLIGKQAKGILGASLTAQLREADQQVMQSHRPIQYKMEIQTNYGFRTFLVSKFPIIDDQGKLRSIGSIATDITDIKQAEERLKLAQQVFSETAEAIIVLDNEQKILSSNRAFIEMSGFNKRHITTAIHSFLSAHPDILQHLQHAPRWQGEGSLLCFDGSSLPILISATLLSSESDAKRYVILFSDITKLKIAEQRVEKERIMLRATADISTDFIFFKDLQSRYLGCNKAFEQFIGLSEKEILGKKGDQFFEPEQALHCKEQEQEVMKNNKVSFSDEYLKSRDGQRHFVEMKKVPLQDKQGQVQGLIALGRDITAHHLLQKRLKITEVVFENSKDAIFVTDQRGNITSVNAVCSMVTGYSENELLHSNVSQFASNQYEQIETSLGENKNWQGEIIYSSKNSNTRFAWLEVYIVQHADQKRSSHIYYLTDLSQIKSTEKKIQFLAKHDPLTGVFNRIALFTRLEDAIARANHKETAMALLLVDINGFKAINEQYGHNAGDSLLKGIAKRLTNCVFTKETVARSGDDEFVIIIDELANEQDAAMVAQKIAGQFNEAFIINKQAVNLSATIGISVYPDDGMDSDTLLGNAEKAMQRGKKDKSVPYHFYTAELTRHSNQQLALEQELKNGWELDQFELYYQPQYDLNKRQLVAVEGILCWNHPQRGLLYPESFLSLLENDGLLLAAIGLHMLRKAATQALTWQTSGINFGRIALSLSEAQLMQISLIGDLQTILKETKCSSRWLEFEVDEVIFKSDHMIVYENLLNIRKLGISLTVDNFAEDRPALYFIEQLNIEKLKMSKRYTEALPTQFFASARKDAVLALACSLRIDVVAESLGNTTEESFSNNNKFDSGGERLQHKAMKPSEATFYLRCNKRR